MLRLIQDQTDAHKLSPPWEGPFVVSKNLHNGSYYLIDIREHKDSRKSEEETRRPWNIAQLRPYYTGATGSRGVHIFLSHVYIMISNKAGPLSFFLLQICTCCLHNDLKEDPAYDRIRI